MTVLSISHHHPFRVPDPALERSHDEALRPNDTIRYADREVGRFVDALEQRGLLANTVVFVLGDHGITRANAAAAGADARYDLMLSRSNVPLIVLAPPGVFAPQVVERLASQVDIPATALQLLGVETTTHVTGHSLAYAALGDRDLPVFVHDLYSGLVAQLEPGGMTVIEVEPGNGPPAHGSATWARDATGRLRATAAPDRPEKEANLRKVVDGVNALYAREQWWDPQLR